MRVFYDLHIHSALSPCAGEDMTPNNIVNMSLIKGLEVIAVTDHNSIKNVPAVIEVAKDKNLLVIPGMEIETSEEVHVLTLFRDIQAAAEMERLIMESMVKIKNRPDIFGQQQIMDENDNVIGEWEQLLLTASTLDIYNVFQKVNELGGVAIPAHVERSSSGIISNLGFIPPDLPVNFVETKLGEFKGHPFISNSDAHYLENISERIHYLEVESLSIENILQKLS